MKKPIILLLLLFLSIAGSIHSNNLRQINNRDGLSNSSVTCLFQDDERFLWIGTFDGLNMYDSRNIVVYKPDINNETSLSSNVIRNITETDSTYLWVSTKWGLNKLSQRSNKIEEYYSEFSENSYLAKDSHDCLYVLGKPDVLSLYSKTEKRFIDLPVSKGVDHNTVSGMVIDTRDTIWINHEGVIERYTVTHSPNSEPQIHRHSDFQHPHSIKYIFYHSQKIIFVDFAGGIYYIDARGIHFIKNLYHLIQERGEIGAIIFDNEDLLIGFKTNGLIRLNAAQKYETEEIEINCGVFSLWKDEQQDIIWIGTDGQGVYAWTKDEYTLNNITLDELPISKKRPIRAIYTDHLNSLWLGTKDNGIIRIKDYDNCKKYTTKNVTHFTSQNGLNNNAVFAFVPSRAHSILWIGSDGPGLNYYSYKDNKIHPLINHTHAGIAKVHSMSETCDSLLWVGSGSTLLRICFTPRGNGIEAKNIRPIHFRVPNRQQYNQIYSIHPENDSILWIGMRGNGVIRLNTQTEAYRLFTFDKNGIAPMNDILCIHQNRNRDIWVGSSYGLTQIKILPNGEYDYKNFNDNEGLPNNTIHGIAEDLKGNLWLSSNMGLIQFDPIKNTFQNLNHKTGLKVIEFSDNAYYQDNKQNRYFFGGVDGIVWLQNETLLKKKFVPEIYFTKLKIFNRDHNISDFKTSKDNQDAIVLNHNQNFFAVSFIAMDFIYGENSQYSYKLENFSNVWMDIRSNEAQFTNIPPGRYILKVRYKDDSTNNEDLTQSLHIIILPPWYQTITAQLIYALLIIATGLGVFRYIHWRYKRGRASIDRKLKAKYKEEMYESKLRFFTNITHEFCTPLTLIYGPCERILQHAHSDDFIRKYAQIIKSNTERLNSLIQEVIDFRRMETGNQICHIQELNISQLANDTIASFEELAEQNCILLKTEIAQDVLWTSDSSCFTKILNNLISNAFKYTPKNGTIRISIQHDENLILKVYNTGKGISRENIPLIFNRYSVLDNIKENSIKGLSSRNGLGLAICQSMVELLRGTIQVESEVNSYAQFIVTLPRLETTQKMETIQKEATISVSTDYHPETKEISTAVKVNSSKKTKQLKSTILIIDDNQELLWMLKHILSDEYLILTAENGEEGLELLKQKTPDLIITDIMMPKINGLTLTKQVKNNKHTVHIPLVILSAKNTTDEKIEGLESGADAYIPKPFEEKYLRSIIKQLLKKKDELKTYYNSAASAFDFKDGQLLSNENKRFLETAIEIINSNMENSNFGPNELAKEMQTSSRALYRKFKELNQPSPKEFIKEQHITHAAKLLLTTALTIQEIMYRTSFTNRSHFYKEFAKHYNQTPKKYRELNKQKQELKSI